MPNFAPLQDDFSAGEISPRLRGKTRSQHYARGLAFCENFEVTPQGSLEMRGGTEHIGIVSDADAVAHKFIIGEVRSLSQLINRDVIVVIGSTELSLFDRDGSVTQEGPSTSNIVIDPTFLQGLTLWDSSFQGVGVVTPISGIGCSLETISGPFLPNNAVAEVSQIMTVNSPNQIHRFVSNIRVDSALLVNGFESIKLEVFIADTNNLANPLYEFTYERSGNQDAPPIGTVFAIDEDVVPLTVELQILYRTTVTRLIPNNNNVELAVTISSIQVIDTTSSITPVLFPTPESWYTEGEFNRLRLIHTCQDSALNVMYFTCYGGDMYKLEYFPNAIDPAPKWEFTAFTPLVGLDDGAAWVAPFPATCTIHQGRLWLGGTPNAASTLWASKTWDYENFTYPTVDPTAEDGLEFTLTSNGAIQWIEGLKNLLIGTDRGEVIGRSTGSVITNIDFDFPLEQTWGSTRIQPAEAGNEALFISIDSNKVRSLYDGGDNVDGYESLDLTFFSENITAFKVVDVTYTSNPDYHLTCLMANGELAISTYYRALDVNGWFRMKSASDPVISITDVNDLVGTSNVFLVRRLNADLTTYISVEIKNAGNPFGYNLDNYITATSDVNGLVTGLDHLDGYECGIVILTTAGVKVEYTLHPDQQPINGEITLEDWATNKSVLVGIKYKATAITLQLEGGNPQGTSQVQKRRQNEIFLRLYNSAIPLVNGFRPAIRTPETPMNSSEPLMTGDTSSHQVGWTNGIMTIEQDLPLPTQISAIFGKAKGNSV